MAANDGPVPVRTLAQAARLIREARQLPLYGIVAGEPSLDYARLLTRVRDVTEDARQHTLLRDDLEQAGVIAVRPTVRAVILTGAGHRAFSVGSDLRQRKDMTKEDWLRQRQDFDRTLYAVRQLRKPIFTAVNGIAYGGGCELAQSTDFIIASDNATFGQPEAMLGLAAGGGSPALLPRLLPPGKAMQMLMTGDPISAQEAYRLGMVNELYRARRTPRRRPPDRREDREQLTDRGTGSQAGGSNGPGRADRASHRDHDGGALALGRPSRSHRRHQRVQRRPRAHLPSPRPLICPTRTHRPNEEKLSDLARLAEVTQFGSPRAPAKSVSIS